MRSAAWSGADRRRHNQRPVRRRGAPRVQRSVRQGRQLRTRSTAAGLRARQASAPRPSLAAATIRSCSARGSPEVRSYRRAPPVTGSTAPVFRVRRLDGAPFYLTPRNRRVGSAGTWRAVRVVARFRPGHTVGSQPARPVVPLRLRRGIPDWILTGIQTCSYTTTMTLADNGMTLGGVGSVTFSPPMLTACDTQPSP